MACAALLALALPAGTIAALSERTAVHSGDSTHGVSTSGVLNQVTNAAAASCGRFGAAVNYAVRAGAFAVAVVDFDSDGKPDAVVTNRSVNDLSVMLYNGDGTPIEDAFNFCNSACTAGQTTAPLGSTEVSCIEALDYFNNGGVFNLSTGGVQRAPGAELSSA